LYACLHRGSEDSAAIQALLAVARDFSPRVLVASGHGDPAGEGHGGHDVLLDVSGLGALIGGPPAIARELRRAVRESGASARVAIAPTQTAARLLAGCDRDAAPIHAAADLPPALAPLPVAALRPLEMLPPGITHRDRTRPYDTLEKWGIATLGALAALPVAQLSSRLGRRGVALHRLARGLDAAPFVPDGETPRFVARLELEWPVDTLEPLSFVFARLLEPLSAALERADRGAAAVRLDLRLTDRSTCARVLQLPAPMRDARVLRTLLLLDLESRAPAAAVDVVSIELDPAPARITQFSLLQRALPAPETLSTLTARLSALLGDTRVGTPVLRDTHRPGAFEMTRYAPQQGAAARVHAGVGAASPPPRGGDDTHVLRRQRIPPAIRVSVERGRPAYIAAAKRGMPHGAVTQAAGPWRTSGGWWHPREGPPWNHDEWDVALSTGVVCRIFQDRTTQQWFLDGLYD